MKQIDEGRSADRSHHLTISSSHHLIISSHHLKNIIHENSRTMTTMTITENKQIVADNIATGARAAVQGR